MTKTDRQWKKWAEQDPYHGVLGRGFGCDDIQNEDVRDLFFGQGETHVAAVLDDAARLAPLKFGAALDFGCGVGRLLRPLLDRYTSVSGVDIAPDMLRITRENCAAHGRLTLATSLDDPTITARRYDLVHSYIVLQHIRPAQGMPIMAQLISLATPGGIVALHFTVGDLNKHRRLLNRIRYRVPPLHWLYNITTGRPWNLPISEMNVYPIEQVLALFRNTTIHPCVSRSYDQNGHQGLMIVAVKH